MLRQNELNMEGMCRAGWVKLSKCQLNFQKESAQEEAKREELGLLLLESFL